MFNHLKNNRGLTLVELLVTMAILGMVLSAAYSFLGLGNRSYTKGSERQNIQSTLRILSDYISNEIRYSTSESLVTLSPGDDDYESLKGVFNDISLESDVIKYKKYLDDDYRYLYINVEKKLISQMNSEKRVLGDNVLTQFIAQRVDEDEFPYVEFKLKGESRSDTYSIESTVQILNTGQVISLYGSTPTEPNPTEPNPTEPNPNSDFDYKGSTEIKITGFKGTTSKLIIPSVIDEKPVTSIDNNTFRNRNLTELVILSSVMDIGNNAFRGNKLTKITIQGNITIPNNMLDNKNDNFRNAYLAGGPGVYEGTQSGTWTKIGGVN